MLRNSLNTIAALVLAFSAAAAWAGDAEAGKSLYPVCTACHGPTGMGNQAMNAPKLAGQESWYIVKQMQLFQNDARGTAPGDMQGMQMAAMAKGPQLASEEALNNDEDNSDLIIIENFISSLSQQLLRQTKQIEMNVQQKMDQQMLFLQEAIKDLRDQNKQELELLKMQLNEIC